jgi:hypothetical protein
MSDELREHKLDVLLIKTFERWTVLEFVGRENQKKIYRCECECGTVRSVIGASLRSGASRSCGCLSREITAEHRRRSTTHGHARKGKITRTFRAWAAMIRRCGDPEHAAYAWYGGRGITVCASWTGPSGFATFLKDMGEVPSGLSLDRADNNGPYSPENCRWVTQTRQQRNRRSNRLLTLNGRTQTLIEWAEETGIHRQTIKMRIDRCGWSVERALTEPVKWKGSGKHG